LGSWRSDVAAFTGGQRVVAGGATHVVASPGVGVVVAAGVGSRSIVAAIDDGHRVANGASDAVGVVGSDVQQMEFL
jgi:hypothetical protein